jgi:hypothetical protein
VEYLDSLGTRAELLFHRWWLDDSALGHLTRAGITHK